MNVTPPSSRPLLRHWLLALHHFTRLPLPRGDGSASDATLALHFPGAGLLVGALACLVFTLVALLLPDGSASLWVAAVACTLASVLLTGGAQEEALAHCAEGLAEGETPRRAAAIMEEPHLGAAGMLALVLAVAAKLALLATLADTSAAGVLTALLAGHVVSRCWPLVLARGLPDLGGTGPLRGLPPGALLDNRGLQLAAAWSVLPLLLMLGAEGPSFMLAALLASFAAFWLVRRLLLRRLQGVTADGLGAAQQACELAFYLGAALTVGYV